MSMPGSFARATSPRPGRASAPMMCTPLSVPAARNAAMTSCAMPPQPISPIAVIDRSLRVKPHARELPLRQLLHGVAHAFAAEAARADAAEGISVEPEAAGVVDPERADPELARNLKRGLEACREAGALQTEFGGVRELERGINVGDALYDHHGTERLLPHQASFRRRLCHDRRTENGAAALGLEHELGAFGNRILDHRFNAVGRCAEMHCWPLASNAAPAMRVAASSRSASAQTIFAALEPSSPTNFFAPAARANALPAAVLPVTLTTATSRWAASSSAVPRPPGTTLKSPSGMPAVLIACAISSATSVPGGDGLTTIALPTASAGATF